MTKPQGDVLQRYSANNGIKNFTISLTILQLQVYFSFSQLF